MIFLYLVCVPVIKWHRGLDKGPVVCHTIKVVKGTPMKFYVSKSFTTRNPHTGRTINATAGSKISQTVYDKLSQSLIERCGIIPARNAPRNGEFTPTECDFLVTQYVRGFDTETIVSNFYDKFQGHKLNDGVECQLRIIAGQDNTTDDQGLSNPGRQLLNSMLTIAPHRFV